MNSFHSLILAIFASVPAFLAILGSGTRVDQDKSDAPPAKKMDRGPKFPDLLPPAPNPITPPRPIDPLLVPVLTPELLYVIEGDEDFLTFTSPKGLANATKEMGPLKIRGQFIDGKGVETREYKSKYVVTVDAIQGAEGRVEIITVTVGSSKESEAGRRTVDVTSGSGPRPPPKPDPIPPPKPVPPGPVPVTSFHVFIVYESADTLTPAQNSVVFGKAVGDYLNLKTTPEGGVAGWRRYDKDTNAANETPVLKALWAAVKPQLTAVPCLVVETNGKADIIPLPATPAEAVKMLTKYAEGK